MKNEEMLCEIMAGNKVGATRTNKYTKIK